MESQRQPQGHLCRSDPHFSLIFSGIREYFDRCERFGKHQCVIGLRQVSHHLRKASLDLLISSTEICCQFQIVGDHSFDADLPDMHIDTETTIGNNDSVFRRKAKRAQAPRPARPGDLPVERLAQFELMIDLKIAQELGLTVPESLLLRADKVFPASGVPLPASIRIVPPDRRVAPELAAFSGKWVGTWEGDAKFEHILVVEAIDPPHIRVIYAWSNGTGGAGTAHPQRFLSDWVRTRGQFVEGALQVFGPGGSTQSYRQRPDGTLAATQTWLGGVSRATMTRAPE
jgi:hypothetical protein